MSRRPTGGNNRRRLETFLPQPFPNGIAWEKFQSPSEKQLKTYLLPSTIRSKPPIRAINPPSLSLKTSIFSLFSHIIWENEFGFSGPFTITAPLLNTGLDKP